MLTSGDIAQQFQQQQAGFMGMQDYSQRIGMSGGGQFGLGQYGSAATPAGLGFNYAPENGLFSPAYGMGNRFAANVASGVGMIGGAAGAASTYLGVAGFLPNMGLPFQALGKGMLGMGVGAGLGAVGMFAGAAATGAQQQYAVNNAVAGYNFFNPASRTGMGFTRQDATAIGGLTRQMAELPQMMTSMEELTRIMARLKSTGTMQGATTATDFGARFREAITTIRETAKILGTTMDDATNFFAHSRTVGFLGRTDQLKNALNVQYTSAMTGMTRGQVQQLQQQGADLSTRLGGRRRIGAETATGLAQTIGFGVQQGRISQEDILNLTGMEGPEGTNAAALMLQESMTRMAMTTPTGTLLTSSLMKVNGDKAEIDKDLLERFQRGELSLEDLKRRSANLSEHDKMVWKLRRGDLSQGLASAPGGTSIFYKSLVKQHGNAGAKLLMQMQGFDPNQIDVMEGMERVASDEQFGNFKAINQYEARIREEKSPEAMWKQMKTKIHAATLGHIENLFSESYNAVAQALEETVDDAIGRHRVAIGKGGADKFAQIMSGNKEALDSMFASARAFDPDTLRKLANKHNLTVGSVASFLPGMKETIDESLYESGSRSLLGLMGFGTDRDKFLEAGNMLGGASNLTKYGAGVGPLSKQGAGSAIQSLLMGDKDFLGETDHTKRLERASRLIGKRITNAFGGSFSEEEIKEMETSDPSRALLIRAYQRTEKEMREKGVKGSVASHMVMTEQGMYDPNNRLSIDVAEVAMRERREQTARGVNALKDETLARLKSANLEPATISALMDSPSVRRNLIKLQKGDQFVKDAINAKDGASRLGISEADFAALQQASTDVTNKGGWHGDMLKQGMNYLEHFDNVTAYTASVERLSAEGMKISHEAESLLRDDSDAVRGYAKDLSELGGKLSQSKLESGKEGYEAGVTGITDYVTKVARDKNLTLEQKRKIASRSGSFGGGIMAVLELDKLKDKKFKGIGALAKELHLGAEGEKMLGELGIQAHGDVTVTGDLIEKMKGGRIGTEMAKFLTPSGQSISSGETVQQQLVNTLRDLNQTQKLQMTMLAILTKKGEKEGKELIESAKRVAQETQ
jgi:hypothetical protein